MINLKNKILSIILICMVFSSCSKKTSPANFSCVPNNASFVSAFNLSNLAKKAKLERLKELEFLKKIENKMDLFKDVTTNPTSTGISFNNDFLIFSLNKNKDVIFSFSLKDVDKFKSFCEAKVPKNQKFVEKDGYSFLVIDKFAIAYKVDLAIILNNSNKGIGENIQYLMTLKKEDRIIENTQFNEFYNKRGDMSIWFSSKLLSQKSNGLISEAKNIFGYDLEDSNIGVHLNFEDDKLRLKWNILPTKNLKEIIKRKRFMTNSFNTELLNYLPKDNAIVSTLSIDSEKYFNRFKEFEKFDKMNASFVKSTNHTIKDLFKSLKGSVAFSYKSRGNQKSKLDNFSVIFERKNDNLLKIVRASVKRKTVQKDGYYEGDKGYYIIHNKDLCMITSSLDAIKAFKEGGYKNSLRDSKLKSKIKANSFYTNFSFDIDKNPILKKETRYNSRKRNSYREWSNFIKDVDLYSNGNLSFELVVNTKESKDNSLFGLLKVIDEMGKDKTGNIGEIKYAIEDNK